LVAALAVLPLDWYVSNLFRILLLKMHPLN